jgi:hypothetical protein
VASKNYNKVTKIQQKNDGQNHHKETKRKAKETPKDEQLA